MPDHEDYVRHGASVRENALSREELDGMRDEVEVLKRKIDNLERHALIAEAVRVAGGAGESSCEGISMRQGARQAGVRGDAQPAYTPAGSPRHNGVVERQIAMTLELATASSLEAPCLFGDSRLPPTGPLWAEARKYASNVINMTARVKNKLDMHRECDLGPDESKILQQSIGWWLPPLR